MDLDQATAALGALLVEDARKADLDAARNVSMGIGRESIQWALQSQPTDSSIGTAL